MIGREATGELGLSLGAWELGSFGARTSRSDWFSGLKLSGGLGWGGVGLGWGGVGVGRGWVGWGVGLVGLGGLHEGLDAFNQLVSRHLRHTHFLVP